MRKSQCCDVQSGLKKGPWTAEEDQKLIDYVQKHGHGRWRTLPKNAGLKRCGKSCRLRWTNYLRPDIKRGKFSIEEEDTIIQLHSVLGNKWSAIAAHLPRRTDNEIKNYWNTHIKKRLLRMGIDPVTHKPRLDILQLYSLLNSPLHHHSSSQLNIPSLPNIGATMLSPSLLNTANSLLSNPPNFQRDRTKDVGSKDFEENLGTTQIGDQIGCLQPNQKFESHAESYSDVSGQYLNQGQFMQTHLEQLCNNNTTSGLGCQTSSWQTNKQPLRVGEDFMENCVYNDDIQNIMNSQFENLPKLSYSSLLSTPSSSTTHLNSSSTNYVNGSTEDERDSYRCDILMFGMPNCQAVNGYI